MAGLYLHIPFCEHKCVYCDFYSVAPKETTGHYEELVDRFLGSLHREIALRGEDPAFQTPYETVFFGGGTPSLLHPSKVEQILAALFERFPVDSKAEITLETNPGTVDLEKLRALKAGGINRISFGIQSFHDDDLSFLTRIHSSEEAKTSVRNAFRAGFENVSVDLIFALPNQTIDRWRSNLEQAVDLNPTHISCYSLIVEPNTPLERMVRTKQVTPLPVEEDARLYEFTMDFLATHGYEQYEVSNFARHGFRSKHNYSYWDHSNYLGFGPSAHSFWDSRRWWNVSNVVAYNQKLADGVLSVAGSEELTIDQLMQEEIFLGLRSDGIDVAGFRKKYRRDLLSDHEPALRALVADNLATFNGERLRLTPKGYLLCDEICFSFL